MSAATRALRPWLLLVAGVVVAGLLISCVGRVNATREQTAIRDRAAKAIKDLQASPTVILETYIDQKERQIPLSADEVARLAKIIEAGRPDLNALKYEVHGTINYQLPDGSARESLLLSIGSSEAGLRIDGSTYLRGLNQQHLDQLRDDIVKRTAM